MLGKSRKYILPIVLAATLLSAGFASAADDKTATTPAKPEDKGIVLNKEKYDKAQKDDRYCEGDYKKDIYNFTNHKLKATWVISTYLDSLPTTSCELVPADSRDGEASKSSLGYILQSKMSTSKDGVTQKDYNDSISKAEERDGKTSSAIEFVMSILAWVVKGLTWVVFNFTALAGIILSWSIDAGLISNGLPVGVHQGWMIVRDIFNMFFILALIIMALANILRIEAYSPRRLLVKLVIMALLINFSEVICMTLISFADNIGLFFAKGANLSSYFEMMKNIIQPNDFDFKTAFSGSNSDLVGAVSGLVVALVMMAAYISIAFLLFVRYIGLIVLIVLSPAAFALRILPVTESYYKKWQDYFIKYLIYFPAVMFFVRLGNLFFERGRTNTNVLANATHPDITLFIIAGFYFAAFYITKTSGLYAANTATSLGQSASSMLGKYVVRGTPIRHAGMGISSVKTMAGGDGKVGFGARLQKMGGKVENFTAAVEGTPSAIKAPFKRAEKARDNLIEKQSRLNQLRLGLIPIDKDTAGKFDFDEMEYMRKKGKLDVKNVGILFEHGNQKQRGALLGMYARDEITDQKVRDEIRYRAYDAVRGNSNKPMDPDYMLKKKDKDTGEDIGDYQDIYIRDRNAEPEDWKIKNLGRKEPRKSANQTDARTRRAGFEPLRQNNPPNNQGPGTPQPGANIGSESVISMAGQNSHISGSSGATLGSIETTVREASRTPVKPKNRIGFGSFVQPKATETSTVSETGGAPLVPSKDIQPSDSKQNNDEQGREFHRDEDQNSSSETSIEDIRDAVAEGVKEGVSHLDENQRITNDRLEALKDSNKEHFSNSLEENKRSTEVTRSSLENIGKVFNDSSRIQAQEINAGIDTALKGSTEALKSSLGDVGKEIASSAKIHSEDIKTGLGEVIQQTSDRHVEEGKSNTAEIKTSIDNLHNAVKDSTQTQTSAKPQQSRPPERRVGSVSSDDSQDLAKFNTDDSLSPRE